MSSSRLFDASSEAVAPALSESAKEGSGALMLESTPAWKRWALVRTAAVRSASRVARKLGAAVNQSLVLGLAGGGTSGPRELGDGAPWTGKKVAGVADDDDVVGRGAGELWAAAARAGREGVNAREEEDEDAAAAAEVEALWAGARRTALDLIIVAGRQPFRISLGIQY